MLPILFSLGPVTIYSYGLFMVIAVLIAGFIIWREGRKFKFDEQKLVDFLLTEAFFALIGARIYYLLLHFPDFGFSAFKWLLFFHFPGLSFLGGLMGGLLGVWVFAGRANWPFWQLGDFLVLGVSLGEAIGRIGAFLSGSAYGAVTRLPWGVPMIGLIGRRHPVQIYEALTALLTFAVLLRLQRIWQARQLPTGLNFILYFLIFGTTRFLLEFLRGDSVYFLGWRTTQIVCLFFILFATILFYKRLGRSVKQDILIIINKIRRKSSYV